MKIFKGLNCAMFGLTSAGMVTLAQIKQALVQKVIVSDLNDEALVEYRRMLNKTVLLAAIVSFCMACLVLYLRVSPNLYFKIFLLTACIHSLSTGFTNMIRVNREISKRRRNNEQI